MNLHCSIKVFFATAALLLTCETLRSESAEELIQKGDVFDQSFQATEALQCYLSAAKLEPKNASLCVRIARQYRHLMSDAPTRAGKLRLGGIALDYSRRAAALAPDDSEAQLAIGITYGKLLPIQSSKEQVESSPRIKDSADKALKLDPRNDLAWHVLGRWNRVLADINPAKRVLAQILYGKLPSTTNEQAVKCFEEAIKINPDRPMHYIELGRTYAQMGRNADARRFLEKGLAMPDTEKDDPENKRLGREVLAKIR